MDLHSVIKNQVAAAILDCCSPNFAKAVISSDLFDSVVTMLCADAAAFASKDPAAGGDPVSIVRSYTSFKAVLHYRISNALLLASNGGQFQAHEFVQLISARGKLLSGAELNPSAVIGERFVMDHGYGTVIGETCTIGDDCYILGGVTLGALGIAGNPTGPRHPRIGNRVQIGAFARIFGSICIGDDTFIGPHCIVTDDVPSGMSVLVRTAQQISRNRAHSISSQEAGKLLAAREI